MKQERFLLSIISALTFVAAFGVPAKHITKDYIQPDGTVLTLTLAGDERFHTHLTSDGLPVMKNDKGFYCYYTNKGISEIKASNPEVRGAMEAEFVHRNIEVLDYNYLREESVKNIRGRDNVKLQSSRTQVVNKGRPRIPVLLLQYKDKKFKDSDPHKTFIDQCSEGSKSAYQYFADQSNGMFEPQFDVYGPYTLSGNRIVYGGNDSNGKDKGIGKMVGEGCMGLDSEIDFSLYDSDRNGECDVVIIIYAGDGEASSYASDSDEAVWPCQWQLSSSDYGRYLTLDGTKVNKFAVFNELNGYSLSKIDGIGTFCHEFSHCLGLPDFYDTEYSGHFGMAHWSLMDYGCYNDDGYTPIGYSAYEKSFMGWLEIEEGKENTRYELPIFNSGSRDTDKAIKLTNDNNSNEYFIFENRKKQGWDKYMPAEGLFIYHVTYSQTYWKNNEVNNYSLQRMTPVPADNELKQKSYTQSGQTYYQIDEESLKGDLWPYNGNNNLTDTSAPAAKLSSGGYLGKPVTEITKNSDGTISFWVMKAPARKLETPEIQEHSIDNNGAVTFSWNHEVDTEVFYTLEINEYSQKEPILIHDADFTKSKPQEWTKDGYIVSENGSTRLGSGSQQGVVISPSLDFETEGVTVIVNARYYNSDNSTMKVSLLDSNNSVIDSQQVTLLDEFEDYTFNFNLETAGNATVRIETIATKKRILITEVKIYDGLIEPSKSRLKSAMDSRVIEGIDGKYHTISDLKQGVTYRYRIKAIPTNTEDFIESEWSEPIYLDMPIITLIDEVEIDNGLEPEYYNLNGIRVKNPYLPGIYIMKNGVKTRKLIVK